MRIHYLCVGTDRVFGKDLFPVSVWVSYTNTISGPIKVSPWKKATALQCGAKCHLKRRRWYQRRGMNGKTTIGGRLAVYTMGSINLSPFMSCTSDRGFVV